MLRLALFLGTNLAIVALISLTFRFLGLEGLLQQNAVNLDINALILYSAIVGFAGSLISLFLSKSLAKATMRVRVIDEPRSDVERWLVSTVHSQAKNGGDREARRRHFRSPLAQRFRNGLEP